MNVTNYLTTPKPRRGVQTSEFLVLAVTVLVNFGLAVTETISASQATKYGTLAAIGYKIARGLAKLGEGAPEAGTIATLAPSSSQTVRPPSSGT